MVPIRISRAQLVFIGPSRAVAGWSNLNFRPLVATYSYLANSPLVSQIVFTNNGQRRMAMTKTYDQANRLENVSSVTPAAASSASFAYAYNGANQRTLRREADGSYWRHEYDARAIGRHIGAAWAWLGLPFQISNWS